MFSTEMSFADKSCEANQKVFEFIVYNFSIRVISEIHLQTRKNIFKLNSNLMNELKTI